MDKYQETFKTWNKIAKVYEDKFMDLDLYNDTYNVFFHLISKTNASILEIGCGPGNITKYLLTKNTNLKIKGIDISPKMIELAKKNNPLAEFQVLDSRDISSIKNKFDAIVCGFCIPYLSKSDCKTLIKDCKKLLNDYGVLYLSFVEGDYKNSGFISGSAGNRAYFYYHNLDDLQTELKTNAFSTKELFYKDYKKANKTEVHTILIAKK